MKEIKEERWTAARYIYANGRTEVFEDYKVSDLGRVKSLKNGNVKILKQGTKTVRTPRATTIVHKLVLRKENKNFTVETHRLVLSSFNPEGWFLGADIDHLTERTEHSCDNRLVNLKWVSESENMSKSHARKAISDAKKNDPSVSKRVKVTFSDGTVKEYCSASEASRDLSLSSVYTIPSCINDKKRKGYYKSMGLHFEYV